MNYKKEAEKQLRILARTDLKSDQREYAQRQLIRAQDAVSRLKKGEDSNAVLARFFGMSVAKVPAFLAHEDNQPHEAQS